MRRIERMIYNILPYYIVKKLTLKYTGEGFILKPKRNSDSWTAQGVEIDYGEWLLVADKEAILKAQQILQERIRKNQERLDDLKEQQGSM